jgi:flavodoxin
MAINRKKLPAVLLAIILIFVFTACVSSNNSMQESADTMPVGKTENRILVVYYSWSGHLDSMAHWVADETGGDLYRVLPKNPYPDNYNQTADRARAEQNNNERPEIVVDITPDQMSQYDTVFFGFPVWWYDLPMCMWTFLESYDFSGKTIIPFFSHEGSSNGAGALPTVERLAAGAAVRSSDALSIRGGNVDGSEIDVRAWVQKLGYQKSENPSASAGKTIVVYFSGSGNTKRVAGFVADELNVDAFELVPVTPYTAADLNWRDRSSRVNKEHDDPSLQNIELAATEVPDWSEYDTVLFGYPIWWREASWVVNSFIKNNDFTGKKVVPFCTSTSSGLGDSGTNLEKMAGTGNWLEGIRFSELPDENSVREWARGLNIK